MYSSKIITLLIKVWYLVTYRFRKPRIHVSHAILTGDGSFIDVRYWLSRPDKVDKNLPIFLLVEATQEKLPVMRIAKYGSMKTRHNKLRPGGVIIFRNLKNLVNNNSRVTLIYGPLISNDVFVSE